MIASNRDLVAQKQQILKYEEEQDRLIEIYFQKREEEKK